MYHNNEISIINLSRLQCIVSVSASVSANNFSTNTRIGNIGKKWYRSISSINLSICNGTLNLVTCDHFAQFVQSSVPKFMLYLPVIYASLVSINKALNLYG